MKHDIELDIALGSKRTQKIYKNQKWMWSKVVDKVQTTVRTPETLADYMKLPKSAQDDIKDVGGFVGGYLEEGRRTMVKHRQLVCLDIDFGDMTIWEMFELVYGAGAVIYSTHKHTKKSPRLRLVIPLDRKVSLDEYQAIARKIADSIDIDAFDDTTYQPQRMMYWPSTSCDGEYICEVLDGPILSADEVLGSYDNWKDITTWPTSSRSHKIIKKSIKKQSDPLGKDGLLGAFCRAYNIHDAIDTFVEDYVPCDMDDRYTYRKGSTNAGIITYDDKFSFSHHATDPASGQLCNAFDLVRLHKFSELDVDTKPDTPVAKSPSFVAMCELASADKKVKKEIIQAKEKLIEEFKDESVSFEEKLITHSRTGEPLPNYANIELILSEDPYFKGKFGYDELSKREVALTDLPWRDIPHKGTWLEDIDDANIRSYFDKKYSIVGKDKIIDSLQVVCRKHSYHPIKEYLESLEWDGTPRIDTLLIDFFGCEDCDYMRAIMRKTLLGAVTRIYEPGCKFDTMLTLKGEQGCGKSSFFQKLGKSWFTDSIKDIKSKDALEGLQGIWIVEMGELSAMKKADSETIKSFLTGTVDRFRVAYGRRTANYPRQCIFVATTNEVEFLRDKTGNRRFWIAGARKSAKPKKSVFDLTDNDFDQFWAEAKFLYDNCPEPLHLSDELELVAKEVQKSFMVEDPKEATILEFLERKLPKNWDDLDLYDRQEFLASEEIGEVKREKVCVAEIWCEALGYGNTRSLNQYETLEINKILDNLPNWEKQKSPMRFKIYGSKRGYKRLKTV